MIDPMTPRASVLPPSCPPIALRREAAAEYVGMSPRKFDACVADGRMPKPKRIDGIVSWYRPALEMAYQALPDEDKANPWDAAEVA
jgi:predicted DNA-binding transcriptional regulator AlpA